MTQDEAQHRRWTFCEAVKGDLRTRVKSMERHASFEIVKNRVKLSSKVEASFSVWSFIDAT
jgi:hypothetical protein